MQLENSTRLGPFEILAPIGSGGMGEVYRARDTRLDRQVAIKVLSRELAGTAGVRERFEREARAISQLSHPHICALFDVGAHDGVDYLVMEYLEGESLAERLKRGALPLDEVLEYGAQIGDALEKAHRHGVTHRDLKPANIMLTRGGAKLLDFGLAKLSLKKEEPLSGLTNVATAHRNLTQEGTILGTFQYMAPEQLEGLEADSRTDIFAFGAVLYEMLTGRKAFEGKNKTSLIAAIVDREPAPISTIQPLTPPALEYLIRKCLQKDPDRRWQSAGDVAAQLRWLAEGSSQTGVAAPARVRRKHREGLAWAIAALALISAAVLAAMWRRAATVPRPRIELTLTTPLDQQFVFTGAGETMALSPDGTKIVFPARAADGRSRLWLRPLRSGTAHPLSGTDGAHMPFWSPDSRYIGFFSNGKMKKIDISGGPPLMLCDANGAGGYRGGSWNRDNVIVFTPNARTPVHQISANGGTPVAITKFDAQAGEYSHRYPWFLPDGKHFVYLARSGTNLGTIMLGSLDGKTRKKLVMADSPGFYTEPGYLLFVRDRTLLAQKFDPRSHELGVDTFPVAENVQFYPSAALAVVTTASRGVIAYQEGSPAVDSQLSWVDRNGKTIADVGPPQDYRSMDLSHDGKRLAITVRDKQNGNDDIWVHELARGTAIRLTFGGLIDDSPVWTPDDREIIFSSEEKNRALREIFIRKSNGEGSASLLFHESSLKFPSDVSPDGKWLAFNSIDLVARQAVDVRALSLRDRKVIPVAMTDFQERTGRFSPDGRWIAYASDESGREEIYAQRWPPTGGEKWQLSVGGGSIPQWRGDGRELFYRAAGGNKMMSVQIDTSGVALDASQPQVLFDMTLRNPGAWIAASDGQRFLVSRPVREAGPAALTVVLNWAEGTK